MLMGGIGMPTNGGSGDGGGRKPRLKNPSGEVQPTKPMAPSTSGSMPAIMVSPMPVVLTLGTIIKLASVIFIPLLGILSGGIYFFHKTNLHIDDKAVHLLSDERPKLETKFEANKARSKMEESIKRELRVSMRELQQDVSATQTVQIKTLGSELKQEQKTWGDRLLKEMQQTRKDVRGQ